MGCGCSRSTQVVAVDLEGGSGNDDHARRPPLRKSSSEEEAFWANIPVKPVGPPPLVKATTSFDTEPIDSKPPPGRVVYSKPPPIVLTQASFRGQKFLWSQLGPGQGKATSTFEAPPASPTGATSQALAHGARDLQLLVAAAHNLETSKSLLNYQLNEHSRCQDGDVKRFAYARHELKTAIEVYTSKRRPLASACPNSEMWNTVACYLEKALYDELGVEILGLTVTFGSVECAVLEATVKAWVDAGKLEKTYRSSVGDLPPGTVVSEGEHDVESLEEEQCLRASVAEYNKNSSLMSRSGSSKLSDHDAPLAPGTSKRKVSGEGLALDAPAAAVGGGSSAWLSGGGGGSSGGSGGSGGNGGDSRLPLPTSTTKVVPRAVLDTGSAAPASAGQILSKAIGYQSTVTGPATGGGESVGGGVGGGGGGESGVGGRLGTSEVGAPVLGSGVGARVGAEPGAGVGAGGGGASVGVRAVTEASRGGRSPMNNGMGGSGAPTATITRTIISSSGGAAPGGAAPGAANKDGHEASPQMLDSDEEPAVDLPRQRSSRLPLSQPAVPAPAAYVGEASASGQNRSLSPEAYEPSDDISDRDVYV